MHWWKFYKTNTTFLILIAISAYLIIQVTMVNDMVSFMRYVLRKTTYVYTYPQLLSQMESVSAAQVELLLGETDTHQLHYNYTQDFNISSVDSVHHPYSQRYVHVHQTPKILYSLSKHPPSL